MKNDSYVNNSGNSKVDVTINIDTTALAYFLGSYLHATKQIDDEQFLLILSNLSILTGKNNDALENLISNFNIANPNLIITKNSLETIKKYY